MDVPSWHPANQDSDAARKLLSTSAAASAKRTEFKVMPGSSADTTTEAGRQFMKDLGHGGDGGGAALYLMEQKRIQEAQKNKRRAEEEAQLQSFRSTALKLQAQKPSALVPEVVAVPAVKTSEAGKSATSISTDKKTPAAIVTIKAKKRSASSSTETSSNKKKKAAKKQVIASGEAAKRRDSTTAAATTEKAVPPPTATEKAVPGALLLGYSSSSDSDNE